MKNITTIRYDAKNLYICTSIKSSLVGKILLSSMLLIFISIVIGLLIQIPEQELSKAIIPSSLLAGGVLYVGGKYLLWNIYGEELIIINNKTISYQYNYGIVTTNLKTIQYQQLEIGFNETEIIKGEQFGNIQFINYRSKDNLPEVIYASGIKVNSQKVQEISNSLSDLLYGENIDKQQFIPFSKN